MSHDAFNRIPETSIPEALSDGRSGDRVAVLGAGVLYVREGRASFMPWDRIYGVTELEGRLHILTPRPLPAAPWYTVHPPMIRGRPSELAERIRAGRPGGGYRDAVRVHRTRMSRDEMVTRVQNKTPIEGGLTVPGTRNESALETKIVFLRYVLIAGSIVATYFWALLARVLWTSHPDLATAAGVVALPLLAAGAALGVGPLIRAVWRRLHTPGRVLVLAPDGCVVGLPSGVKAFRWDELGPFRNEGSPKNLPASAKPAPLTSSVFECATGRAERGAHSNTEWRNQVEAIVIEGADGTRLGELSAQYVEGPVKLLAAVANTYREAASA